MTMILIILSLSKAEAVNHSLLVGTWNSNCLNWTTAQTEQVWSKSEQRVFSEDGTFVFFSTTHRGTGCRGQIYLSSFQKGTFQTGERGMESSLSSLNLKYSERQSRGYNSSFSDETERLVILEKDIFELSSGGQQVRFGERVFHKPKDGEDLISQLMDRPLRVNSQILFTKVGGE